MLFFLLFYSHSLLSTRWLELALGITLYFFAASMFKEVIQKEDEEREFEEKAFKYGYITIVSLESVENATVLAALTFIDISVLIGAAISIAIIIIIALSSKHIIAKNTTGQPRLISGILLAITTTSLIIYSSWSSLSTMVALDNSTAWLMWLLDFFKMELLSKHNI